MTSFRFRACSRLAASLGSVLLLSSMAHAQIAASVEGHAMDASGQPIPNAVIRLVSDPTSHAGHTWRYTLIGDSLGKFRQEGLAPGAYLVMLFTDGKGSDLLKTLQLKAGETRKVDFTLDSRHTAQIVPQPGDNTTIAGKRSMTH